MAGRDAAEELELFMAGPDGEPAAWSVRSGVEDQARRAVAKAAQA